MDDVEGARTFAVLGSTYDSFMGRYSVPLAELFADAAGVSTGARALDVGCGPGALTGFSCHASGRTPSTPVTPRRRSAMPVRHGIRMWS